MGDDNKKYFNSIKSIYLDIAVFCNQKTLSTVRSSASSSDAIWNDKCVNMERKINDLSLALTKMEEEKLRREIEYQEAIKAEKDRLAQVKYSYIEYRYRIHMKSVLKLSL